MKCWKWKIVLEFFGTRCIEIKTDLDKPKRDLFFYSGRVKGFQFIEFPLINFKSIKWNTIKCSVLYWGFFEIDFLFIEFFALLVLLVFIRVYILLCVCGWFNARNFYNIYIDTYTQIPRYVYTRAISTYAYIHTYYMHPCVCLTDNKTKK